MPYCSNCGQKLEENFYFCPRCGVKTKAGTAAGVTDPWENIKEAFVGAMEQMNKAFLKASEEMRKAFKEVRKEFTETTSARKIVCASCGATNSPESKFCSKCGKSLS